MVEETRWETKRAKGHALNPLPEFLMTLIIQIAVGVILGIALMKWLPALPHKLRVKGYTRSLLTSSDSDIMLLALHGHEQIFSMPNRDLLIELYFCKDAAKRRDLAARIAQDAADRWAKV